MNLIKALLLPPGTQILLLLLAALCWFRYQTFSATLAIIALLSLYLLSTSFVANHLMHYLENIPVVTPTNIEQSQAIVVLGTSVAEHSPEYSHVPQPGEQLRARLEYALLLSQKSGRPILVTGGKSSHLNEAEIMYSYLHKRGIEALWRETRSRNTHENATFSAPMLQKANIKQVLLVSHAWHLRRGCEEFRLAGINCVPAPTAFARQTYPRLALAWLPQASELLKSQIAIKEYLGLLWIKIRYPWF